MPNCAFCHAATSIGDMCEACQNKQAPELVAVVVEQAPGHWRIAVADKKPDEQ